MCNRRTMYQLVWMDSSGNIHGLNNLYAWCYIKTSSSYNGQNNNHNKKQKKTKNAEEAELYTFD